MDAHLVSWVDIDTNELFVMRSGVDVEQHGLAVKPSVVLHHKNGTLFIGCDVGLCEFDLVTKSLLQIAEFPADFDLSRFRSNDGCRLQDGRYLLGTMRRDGPEDYAGDIYMFDNSGHGTALRIPMHIPNGFIVLYDGNVLVADSCNGAIYELNVDDRANRVDMKQWRHDVASLETPDGGCSLADGSILFADWSGEKLVQFAPDGRAIGKFTVPVRHVSNCKYRESERRLYVTSASVGLDVAKGSSSDCGHALSCAVEFDG